MEFNYSDIFVTISTDKVQLLADFYSQLLNQLPQTNRLPIFVEFQLRTFRLAIFKPKAERHSEFADRHSSSSMSLCLEVEDLDKAIAYITDLGYPPPGEIIEASHGREIYAYDPDGNRLILHQSPQ